MYWLRMFEHQLETIMPDVKGPCMQRSSHVWSAGPDQGTSYLRQVPNRARCYRPIKTELSSLQGALDVIIFTWVTVVSPK